MKKYGEREENGEREGEQNGERESEEKENGERDGEPREGERVGSLHSALRSAAETRTRVGPSGMHTRVDGARFCPSKGGERAGLGRLMCERVEEKHIETITSGPSVKSTSELSRLLVAPLVFIIFNLIHLRERERRMGKTRKGAPKQTHKQTQKQTQIHTGKQERAQKQTAKAHRKAFR